MKASRIGEIAKIRPALINGKRLIGKVYKALSKLAVLFMRGNHCPKSPKR
jgi:hypothetical protein